jgi:hypothetical protein
MFNRNNALDRTAKGEPMSVKPGPAADPTP